MPQGSSKLAVGDAGAPAHPAGLHAERARHALHRLIADVPEGTWPVISPCAGGSRRTLHHGERKSGGKEGGQALEVRRRSHESSCATSNDARFASKEGARTSYCARQDACAWSMHSPRPRRLKRGSSAASDRSSPWRCGCRPRGRTPRRRRRCPHRSPGGGGGHPSARTAVGISHHAARVMECSRWQRRPDHRSRDPTYRPRALDNCLPRAGRQLPRFFTTPALSTKWPRSASPRLLAEALHREAGLHQGGDAGGLHRLAVSSVVSSVSSTSRAGSYLRLASVLRAASSRRPTCPLRKGTSTGPTRSSCFPREAEEDLLLLGIARVVGAQPLELVGDDLHQPRRLEHRVEDLEGPARGRVAAGVGTPSPAARRPSPGRRSPRRRAASLRRRSSADRR